MDKWLGLQENTPLVPAVEDVNSVVQLRAGIFGTSRTGKLKVDGVYCQALLSKAGVLRKRGK